MATVRTRARRIIRGDTPRVAIKGDLLAKPNYQFEKRQRDLAKKRKQEEKRLHKLAQKAAGAGRDEASSEQEDTSADGAEAASADEQPGDSQR